MSIRPEFTELASAFTEILELVRAGATLDDIEGALASCRDGLNELLDKSRYAEPNMTAREMALDLIREHWRRN